MPSLIYITRIPPLSPELAQDLKSSGLHVKSFGPGEITADECLLVMTSEAVLAGLQLSGIASATGQAVANRVESQARPPLQNPQEHLGSEAAIWSFIKAARSSQSPVGESTAVSGRPPSPAPTVAPAMDSLGFVPSQAGSRVLAASQHKAAAASPLLPVAQKRAGGSADNSGVPQLPELSTGKPTGERPSHPVPLKKPGSFNGIRSVSKRRDQRMWQPAVMVAALLIFAGILLGGRASILPSTADVALADDRNTGIRSDSIHKVPGRRFQSAQPSSSLDKAPKLAVDAQRHISDYDFVAEDYTTHFDLQGHRVAAPRTANGAKTPLIQKRVVFN
jgi:hypothetical protein